METTGEWREGTRPEMGVVRSSFGQCASHPDVPDDGEPQQGADEAKHRTAMVLSCVAGVPCADMCHMGLRIDQCPSQLRDSWGGAGATELSMDSGCNSERKEDTHRESDNEPHYHSVPAPGAGVARKGFSGPFPPDYLCETLETGATGLGARGTAKPRRGHVSNAHL